MMRRFALLAILLFTAGAGVAQSPKELAKALETSLLKQPRVLRGFSLDRDVVWRWDGSSLKQEPSLGHMLAVVEIRSVKLRGDRVEMQGVRRELLRATDTTYARGNYAAPVRVEVEFAGGDPTKVLPMVESAVFYPDEQTALADIPREYRGMLPQDETPGCCTAQPNRGRMPTCPADATTGKRQRMIPPRVLSSAEPQFSEEARQKKLSGNVMVGIQVSPRGETDDLWVIQPMGFGLDEKAIEAVSRYQFRPATCGDAPTATRLFIEVNFQIF